MDSKGCKKFKFKQAFEGISLNRYFYVKPFFLSFEYQLECELISVAQLIRFFVVGSIHPGSSSGCSYFFLDLDSVFQMYLYG